MLGLWVAFVLLAPPETAEVELTAERLLHDGKKELTTAEGRAKLVAEDAAVDADRIVYDRGRRVATATGHVVARLTDGGRIVVIADLLTLRFDEQHEVREVFLYDGKALSKKDVSAPALLAADTAEKAQKVGVTQALLEGNHLLRDGTKWTVDSLELVPCECDFENPSWSVTSSSATIDTEAERVSITNPVFRIKHVPVLWLPWLSLPLTDRQSGLLFTRPGFHVNNGFSLEQPVYLTLGRSADITLTPGFFTGTSNPLGIAGPRLGTEFRYTPSTRATGKVLLGLLYDFRGPRDILTGARGDGHRGLRGELGWQHLQDFGKGFGARADVNVHSDGDYNRDLTVDVVLSTATYLRSGATLFHRGADHYVGLDVGLRQDIQWGYDVFGNRNPVPMGPGMPNLPTGRYGPGTLQRLPAITFGWAPTQRLGPLRFDVEGDAVRLAPLYSLTGDEGAEAKEGAIQPEDFSVAVDRLFNPAPGGSIARVGVGDREWQEGEREARDRLMVLPRLSLSATPGSVLSLTAFAAWRQLAWVGEQTGRTWSRGYLLLGGRVETELSRTFDNGALRHIIQPLAEARAIPFGYELTTAPAPLVAYDAVDAAVPNVKPRFQGVVELRQRLVTRGGSEVLRLDLGQGFELSGDPASQTSPIGETYGRLGTRIGWFSAQGIVRVDPIADRYLTKAITPTRLTGRVELDDGKHGAWVQYEQLQMEGTARSRQPLDLLFLIDRGYTSSTLLRQLTFGGRWDFGPVSLGYSALMGEANVKLEDGTFEKRFGVQQQFASVGIAPACDCWRLDLTALLPTWPDLRPPSFGFNVTISKFGTIGAR